MFQAGPHAQFGAVDCIATSGSSVEAVDCVATSGFSDEAVGCVASSGPSVDTGHCIVSSSYSVDTGHGIASSGSPALCSCGHLASPTLCQGRDGCQTDVDWGRPASLVSPPFAECRAELPDLSPVASPLAPVPRRLRPPRRDHRCEVPLDDLDFLAVSTVQQRVLLDVKSMIADVRRSQDEKACKLNSLVQKLSLLVPSGRLLAEGPVEVTQRD